MLGKGEHWSADMQIILHHVYEYRKGIRSLVLHTAEKQAQDEVERVLKLKEIEYYIQNVSENKINIFFGRPECIKIIKSFRIKSLSELNNEQDFILGIMLGYDRTQQYKRYLNRSEKNVKYQERTIVH